MRKYEVEKQIASHIENLSIKAEKAIEILPHSDEYTKYLHHILDYVVGRCN